MITPEQATREVKTPSGEHTIVVKEYLTGTDRRATRRLAFELVEAGKGKSLDALEAAENDLIKRVIVSIDGDPENIVDRVLAMKAEDYDFVVDEVNSVSAGLSEKKETTSDGSTPITSEESA